MRKLSIVFAILFSQFFLVSGQNDKINQLFDKYQEVEGVTSIKIAKPMFSLLSKLDIKDSELESIKPLLGKIQGLKIMIIENEEGASGVNSLKSKISNEISSSVNKLNLQELMSVNSKGSKIKFLSGQEKDGVLDDLLLNINSDGNTVLMMLDGKISMDDLNNLMNEVEVNTVNSSTNSRTETNSSSSGSKEVRNLENFTGVSAGSGVQVIFTQSPTQKVSVQTDNGNLQYIRTEVKNGILNVNIDKKGNNRIKINKAIVTLEAPKLQSLNVSSGANFTTTNTVTENDMRMNISSGGAMKGSFVVKGLAEIVSTSGSSSKINLTTDRLDIKSNSGASVSLDGSASKADFELSSAAAVDASGFKASEVDVSASSAATLKVHATKSLNSRATSGASILYSGNPTVKSVANSGGGSTKQK